MGKHTIEISDENGKSFKLVVSLKGAIFSAETGTWRSLDRGYIRYNSGVSEIEYLYRDHPKGSLYLSPSQGGWGLRINDYCNMWTGVYEQGTGYLVQPWVLDFEPYRIYWAMLD